MMQYKLSIILPIYNVEKFLEHCIKSLIENENFKNTEIILVDDGSTDTSGEIVDHYAKEYSNIVGLHKINGGLSDARNYGAKNANGKYIYFLDSDDFCDNGFIDEIFPVLDMNLDCITFDAKLVDENNNMIERKYNYSRDNIIDFGETTIEKFVLGQLNKINDYYTTVWLNILNRDFFIKHNLYFKKGIIHEDEEWYPRLIEANPSVFYMNKKFYNYRIRSNSIMTSTNNNGKHISILCEIFNENYKLFSLMNISNKFKKKLLENTTKRYLHDIRIYPTFEKDYHKNINKRSLLRYSYNLKNLLQSLVLFLLGYRIYLKVLAQ